MKNTQELVSQCLKELKEPSAKELIPTDTTISLTRFAPDWNDHGDPERVKLYEAANVLAHALNRVKPYWLTLCGPPGIGKTMLAKAVYDFFMGISRFHIQLDVKRQHIYGNTGMFADWRKITTAIKGGSYGLVEDLCEEHFVVLDDIGSEYDPSGFLLSTLDRICNNRLRKWTMLTTNLTIAQITDMEPRIASRLFRDDGIVIESNAEDYSTVALKAAL